MDGWAPLLSGPFMYIICVCLFCSYRTIVYSLMNFLYHVLFTVTFEFSSRSYIQGLFLLEYYFRHKNRTGSSYNFNILVFKNRNLLSLLRCYLSKLFCSLRHFVFVCNFSKALLTKGT